MTRLFFIALIAVVAMACGPGAQLGASGSIATGSAYLPPNISSGKTTMISYREVGGPFTRAFFKVALGNPGISTSTSQYVSYGTECVGGTCYRVKTTYSTTVVTDSPEEQAAKIRAAKARVEALGRSEIPVEFRIDYATRSLGGDTTGWMSSMMLLGEPRRMGPLQAVQFSGGLGFGKLKFHDRVRTTLSPNLMVLEQTVDEIGYSYVGIPIRMTAALGTSGLRSHIQADFNILTLIDQIGLEEGDTAEANPLRFGVGFKRGIFSLDGELIFGRLNADALTAMLELAIVLGK